MRHQEGEGVAGVDLDVHLGKAAADVEAAAVEQEVFVGVRAAGGEGKAAEDGDEDVGVPARDVLPVGQVEAAGFEGVAQFEQGAGAAHFLHGEDVGLRARMLRTPWRGGRGLGAGFAGGRDSFPRCRWRRGRFRPERAGAAQQRQQNPHSNQGVIT